MSFFKKKFVAKWTGSVPRATLRALGLVTGAERAPCAAPREEAAQCEPPAQFLTEVAFSDKNLESNMPVDTAMGARLENVNARGPLENAANFYLGILFRGFKKVATGARKKKCDRRRASQ
jgi:hypothetical protein